MGKRKKPKYRVIGHDGVPCPRCRRPTEIREHTLITQKHLNQPYYYSRWFNCLNPGCVVSLHMIDQFKVFPERRELWTETEVEVMQPRTAGADEAPPWE